LEISADHLWLAYIWVLRRRLPSDSYIVKEYRGYHPQQLVWKYTVGSAIAVLADINAKKYAIERAAALKAIASDYESLILEFIGQRRIRMMCYNF
jgi:hypothetical protein